MIFPEFDNIGSIDKIRSRYDPLADLVRPHITLVFPYDPHMTVGKTKTAAELEEAYNAVASCTEVFSTTVTKISVEMIGEHEESIIIIEKELK